MSEAPQRHVTEAEYLALERTSEVRHEYVNGEMHAMAGGTPLHAAIAANLTAALRVALRGSDCGVASSDLRVHVRATGFYTYPDLTVVCGRVERHPEDDTVILNPTLVAEVLSPSTEAYDRGAKFRHYERIQTLAEYLLVAADGRRLEHFRRLPTGQWLRTVVDASDEGDHVLELPSVRASIRLEDVTDGLDIFR